jgi:hypothetical protein
MRVCWIISEEFASTHVTPEQLKDIAPSWGSWKTWRAWNTDNVLCDNVNKAQELIQRAFHSVCNFYTANKNYAQLNRPARVNLYEGDFPGALDRPEEIIAMHLVAKQNDLVLLLGFDLTDKIIDDKYENHKQLNYINAFRATLNTYPNTQWVLIDHPEAVTKKITLPNLTKDSFDSVVALLKQ